MKSVVITHNFNGEKFKWLYAKYANGCNPFHHCTNAIRGKYSKRFSRLHNDFQPGQQIVMDEYWPDKWDAIYICGVASQGYSKHQNYPHNVHAAIIPQEGASDVWNFENWEMSIENGFFEHVPSEKDIPSEYLKMPKSFWSCRMYRWAIWHYHVEIQQMKEMFTKLIEQKGFDHCVNFCYDMKSLREDYCSDKDKEFVEDDFHEWIKKCLRDEDAVSEQDFGSPSSNYFLREWEAFLERHELSSAFENGVEKFIQKEFHHGK